MMLLTCLFIGIGLATAQNQRVTGVVVSSDDGEPVVGATVLVVGSNIGTITNVDGKFILPNVPMGHKTLRISFVGMATQNVTIKSGLMHLILEASAKSLDEVVVTAMGIKKSEKALGYAATTVNGDKISDTRSSDLMSSLSGQIAGVEISSSSSDPGASNSVIIRGVSSLSGSNQPLYVIDGVPMSNNAVYTDDGLNNGYDFGSGASMVNPDDVASMTVLKGAAATALYGSRAANGVILITTKIGKKHGQGLGIEYNGGVEFQNVLRLPEMQNEFGMGWSGNKTMLENGSWGPRFDGSKQLWGNVYDNSQKLKSYVPIKDNVKDFFDTGVRYNNSISLNGATDNSTYFVSFSQISNDGMLPTSADTFDKYTFSVRASQKVGNLKLSTAVNYASQRNGFSTTGQGMTMINSLYQIPRDVSIVGLKDLSDPFNTPGYYFTPYGVTNPYYVLENNQNTYKAEKIYGKFEAEYTFLKYFKATYRIGLDATNSERHLGTPNLEALYPNTPNWNDALKGNQGKAEVEMTRRRQINQDILLTFNKKVSDFDISVLGGFNYNERKYSNLDSYVTNLDIPTWYNLSNSASTPVVKERSSRRRLYGFFGQIDLSWKDMLYLTGTARNDWSSTLPKDNRSFFYPGVTASFVASELFPEGLKSVLSFAKVRVAYGQTGNDAEPYMIDPYYLTSSASGGFGSLTFPLKGVNAFTLGNTLGNNNLSPEITTEYEAGLNVAFFKGRISLDASYYNRNSDKQIFSLDMDPASGYTAQNINLGKIRNRGVELLLSVKPIVTNDFSWDVSCNFTKNSSKVISLPKELGGIALLEGLSGGTSMYAITGKPVGVFKAEVAQHDPEGHIVVGAADGLPVAASSFGECGNMNYDYEMGLSTTLKYKSVSLAVDFDFRHGGVMYSRTKNICYFTGNAKQTTYNDRNPFVVPNSVNAVKASDGTVSYVENTTSVSQGDICKYWDNGATQMGSSDLVDKSYIKLRSVVLAWELPQKWLAKTPLRAVKVSAYGNNLFLWTPSSNTFIDPELSSFGNDLKGKFGEYSANPSSRRIGFNLMAKF